MKNKVVVEVNGSAGDTFGDDSKSKVLEIRSHWNYEQWVHLRIGEEKVLIVATDLEAAIRSATRS